MLAAEGRRPAKSTVKVKREATDSALRGYGKLPYHEGVPLLLTLP
jgi:hypothetical protein